MSSNKKNQLCVVRLLDGEEYTQKLNVDNTYGIVLFDLVCNYVKITEKDYFSLRFIHPKDKMFTWLNNRKTLKKQLKEGPYTFYLAVKFYPPDPCTLQEDLTRYLFVLSIRDLFFMGKLSCSVHYQLLLSSFIVQAQFGDWNEALEESGYLKDIKFVPNQNDTFNKNLIEYHKKQKGLTPEEVELQFLKTVKDLTIYGVELHDVKNNNTNDCIMGVSYRGINLFENDTEQYMIFWSELVSVSFFKKSINLKIKLPSGSLKVLSYKCSSRASTKRLYRDIIDHHTFFRRPLPLPPISGISLSSKFRYNGRKTYLQLRRGLPIPAGGGNKSMTTLYENEDTISNISRSISMRSERDDISYEEDTYEIKQEKEIDEISFLPCSSTKDIMIYETQILQVRYDNDGKMIKNSLKYTINHDDEIYQQQYKDYDYEPISSHVI